MLLCQRRDPLRIPPAPYHLICAPFQRRGRHLIDKPTVFLLLLLVCKIVSIHPYYCFDWYPSLSFPQIEENSRFGRPSDCGMDRLDGHGPLIEFKASHGFKRSRQNKKKLHVYGRTAAPEDISLDRALFDRNSEIFLIL